MLRSHFPCWHCKSNSHILIYRYTYIYLSSHHHHDNSISIVIVLFIAFVSLSLLPRHLRIDFLLTLLLCCILCFKIIPKRRIKSCLSPRKKRTSSSPPLRTVSIFAPCDYHYWFPKRGTSLLIYWFMWDLCCYPVRDPDRKRPIICAAEFLRPCDNICSICCDHLLGLLPFKPPAWGPPELLLLLPNPLLGWPWFIVLSHSLKFT